MKKPLVSIIMPAFNSELFIGEAINSVLRQSFSDWELIICDDASVDTTIDICKDYETQDIRIRLVQNQFEKGASGARNSCLVEAKGRYIAFLDSDDIWLQNKLESQLSFMHKNGYAFTYSYHRVMSEDGIIIGDCYAPSRVNNHLMHISNFIPCLTVVYDTFIIGKVFQPNIVKRNDFALWLTILNGGNVKYAYCLPEVTACYRANSYGLSSNKFQALKYFYRCLVDYSALNKPRAGVMTSFYLVVVLVKKVFPKLYNKVVLKL